MTEAMLLGDHKFVTFKLDEETYALPIEQVREVLEFDTVTKVPNTPRFVRGVINLRGSVLPVVDLRAKFGMGQTAKTLDTRVLIVEISVDGEATTLGAMADSVRDVIDLAQSEIEPPPKIGTRLRTEFIRGIGRKDEAFVMILDIEQVFTFAELTQVSEIEQSTGPLLQESESASETGGGPTPEAQPAQGASLLASGALEPEGGSAAAGGAQLTEKA